MEYEFWTELGCNYGLSLNKENSDNNNTLWDVDK